jgi:hypothetical protein
MTWASSRGTRSGIASTALVPTAAPANATVAGAEAARAATISHRIFPRL